ncbi:MAG: hypothetical protein ACRYGM_13795 [Janthinobacterium lividum]
MRGVLVLGVLLAGATGASAQMPTPERPVVVPTRDVDVLYQISAGQQPLEQRTRFTSAAQRMRVDMPTPGVYSIMDYRNHMMSFVVEGDRAALDTPIPPSAPAYVRVGGDRVAGLPCTEWQTQDIQHQPVITCFTDDGVMLRVRRGTMPMAVATRVSYAPVDPALFDVPAGFSHVTRRSP